MNTARMTIHYLFIGFVVIKIV